MIIFNSLLKLVVKAFSVRTTLTTDDKGEIDVYLSNYGSHKIEMPKKNVGMFASIPI